MRVIAGSARGRRLRSVPGDTTRPITDRVKESLFNILGGDVIGCRFLDLFGGTGAVGIEALSRGAAFCTFVDKNERARRTILQNLHDTGLSDRAEVLRADAFAFLRRPDLTPYDIIYVAPPQYQGLWRKALEQIDARPELLTQDGLVIVQIHPKEAEEVTLRHLVLEDERRYGSTLLRFYCRAAFPEATEEAGAQAAAG
ncbi:MAG: 16S rRNA (guanine(966)-N(2))-methyltransferase RsmD [Anaerolineae bacterium]